jgi:hypothetical protein
MRFILMRTRMKCASGQWSLLIARPYNRGVFGKAPVQFLASRWRRECRAIKWAGGPDYLLRSRARRANGIDRRTRSTASAKDELVNLATQLMVEKA